MLDRRLIRERPDLVRHAIEVKGVSVNLDEVLTLDERVHAVRSGVEEGQRLRRELARQFQAASEEGRPEVRRRSRELDDSLRSDREDLRRLEERLQDLLLRLPGIPWEGAPVGPDESANTVLLRVGTPPEFDFQPLDHVDLAESRGWVEFARARSVAGERGYVLTGDLVMLERALHSYALDVLSTEGFRVVSVPSLVREQALVGSGYLPHGREEVYTLPGGDLFLAGTAEVALCGLHGGEILAEADLPVLYAGISPCFRREIGSASRDVRGLLRVHQFEKVEQFVICRGDPEESARWHASLLGIAEGFLQALGVANEVVECSTGDMGLGKLRMNDINTWFPSLATYRETHSCSTLHDWQARRAGLRYRDGSGRTVFVHTLNNTAVATPRLLAALLENFQTEDRQIRVPEPLRPYLHGREPL